MTKIIKPRLIYVLLPIILATTAKASLVSNSTIISTPVCSKILINRSPIDNILETIAPEANRSMENIKTMIKYYPLQKNNKSKNNIYHQFTIELNSLIDKLVLLQRVSWNKQNTTEESNNLELLANEISSVITDVSKLPQKALIMAVNVRQKIYFEMITHKSHPIGFLTDPSSESIQDSSISSLEKYAPKFTTNEPSYEHPYGAETIKMKIQEKPSPTTKVSMGFISESPSIENSKSNMLKSIGFIQPDRFIDDSFLYRATLDTKSGQLELIKVEKK